MATTTKTVKEIAAVPVYAGLCTTCNHAATCVNRKAAGDVMYCDMFDDLGPADNAPVHTLKPFVATPNGNGASKGLCGNCESHGACAHETAGGKWYCEQYQ